MITQIKDALYSRNIIEDCDYPIGLYEGHVTMMNIKWTINGLMRHATMDAVGHEIYHEGEAPNER